MKREILPTIADELCAKRSKRIKSVFLNQIEKIIDWAPIINIITQYYKNGQKETGKPAYDGLLLFKMCLLQTWYGLSDYEAEDRLNDSISFSYFCGLGVADVAPDHSTLSRFRTTLTENKVFELLFKEINSQLEKHEIIVKRGAIVDASVIDTPLKPKGKTVYQFVEDKKEENEEEEDKEEVGKKAEVKNNKEENNKAEVLLFGEALDNKTKNLGLEKVIQPGVDTDAAWVKKASKLRYGYKKHVVTDTEGLVLGVVTTAANVNEISNLEVVLNSVELPQGVPLFADKGYQSAKNAQLLKDKKLKNRILKKAKKNSPLCKRALLFNKTCGKTRFKVERTFGSIKRWFNSVGARYKGIAKMHSQNILEAIAYNLYCSPGIIMSKFQK